MTDVYEVSVLWPQLFRNCFTAQCHWRNDLFGMSVIYTLPKQELLTEKRVEVFLLYLPACYLGSCLGQGGNVGLLTQEAGSGQSISRQFT